MFLNVGCGDDPYGDVRIDIFRTKTANIIASCEYYLPFKPAIFDTVFSRNLFEHLKNQNFGLSEMKRITKPDGTICLITDNASYWRFHFPKKTRIGWRHGGEFDHRGIISAQDARELTPKDRHYALFQLEHLLNHCDSLDLIIVEKKYVYYGDCTTPRHMINKVLNLLGFNYLAFPRIRIVAKKKP